MMDRRPLANASVHGARGLFAVMVFAFHVGNSGLTGWLAADGLVATYLIGACKFGVELFFGISGFVILGALARAPSLSAFAWDRVTRIYPLLWTTLIAITLVSAAVGHWLPSPGEWLLNFAAPPPFFPLAQVNPAAWSLGYEVTFYALCALFWANRNNRVWRAVALVTTAATLVLFPRAVLMPVGVAVAAGALPVVVRRTLGQAPLLSLVLFLVGWRMVDLACKGDMMQFTPFDQPFGRWLALVPLAAAAALCGAAALGGIVEQRGPFTALLRTPVLQWLGTISYSFYLWHPVAMSVGKTLLIKSGLAVSSGRSAEALLVVLSLPLSLIVAHFSQRLIEVRLTRTLRRHGPRDDLGAAPLTAIGFEPRR